MGLQVKTRGSLARSHDTTYSTVLKRETQHARMTNLNDTIPCDASEVEDKPMCPLEGSNVGGDSLLYGGNTLNQSEAYHVVEGLKCRRPKRT
jgi:hypothetical protein